MANQLKVATVHSILTLRERGWSYRRIARELGIHRDTVSRYVKLATEEAEAGDSLPGSGNSKPAKPAHRVGHSKPANPPTGSGPSSTCEPFREAILTKLEQGLSYQRIWQDLQADYGFAGGYDSVKRFARRVRRCSSLPFRRMCIPFVRWPRVSTSIRHGSTGKSASAPS